MMKNLREKIASGLVLGCLILSLGTLVFAAPQGVPDGPPPGGESMDRGDFSKRVDAPLSKLVANGTISPDQKDAIIHFFAEKDKERKGEMKATHDKQPKDMLNELMNAGGLTTEQAKAVDDALRPPMPPGGPRGDMPQR